MFGWIDRAAGHVPLPGRLARRAARDEAPGPPAAYLVPDPDGEHRWLWVGGAALAVLLLVIAPLTALMLSPEDGTGRQSASDDGGALTEINVPPPSPEQLMPQSSGDVPNPADNIMLSATVQTDGTAAVTESLTLSPQTRNLVLAVPQTATPPGSSPSEADAPQALSVVATSNGQVVGSPTRVGVTPVSIALPAGTNRVVLHYLLVGSTVRSTPSKAGRALTAIAPITARSQPGLGLVIQLRGSDTDIRNLVCPAAGRAGETCATQADGHWRTTTELTAATGFGLAQVDLPD